MIYRKFEQSWDNIPDDKYNNINVMNNFVKYCVELNDDLHLIKKEDEEIFNKLSKNNIDVYIGYFEKLYTKFLKICVKNFESYMLSCELMQGKFKDDLIQIDGKTNICSISKKYFPKLEKLAKKMFLLEYDLSLTTKKIWDEQLTNPEEYDSDKNYVLMLTAKFRNRRNETFTKSEIENVKKFVKDVPIEYSSVNTEDYTFIFEQDWVDNIAGLVYKINGDAIVSASFKDMFSTPYKNKENPFRELYRYSNVMRLFEKDGYEIYGLGTRICTPKAAILGSSCLGVREVLLDKSKIKPVAVFYLDKYDSNKIPERAKELMEEYNIKKPPVKITPRNKYHYYDLREFYGDF